MSARVEQLEFQAEARQLLDLLVHSVYSNKDSFLRELISNASDALDKLRLETLRNKDLTADISDLHIDIEVGRDPRTLTVRDNGIGMTREEVVDLIGTLAKSGTGELRRQLQEAKKAADSEELIGQFGVGFYSTFMVADKVELLTRKAGESGATRWVSSGDGTYTIESVDDAPQGTSVTLYLKPEDAEDQLHDYTAEWKIRELVKKYSDFIAWPVRMQVERHTPAGEDGSPDTVTVETQTLNSMKALWAKPKDEVSEEEYHEFYKHIAHAWDDPLAVISMRGEGSFEYQALLFIPSHAPFDLFTRDAKAGVQLYIKRVFVMGDCEELMPGYLRFVKGVVDAQGMSLNVSREILQQDRQVTAIRRRLTKKVLTTIADLQSSKPEDYRTFWTQFGAVLKEGLMSDMDNQDTLLRISSFASTFSDAENGDGGVTTLPEYVARMKDGQEQIFYATGPSVEQLQKSPHLEAFKAKGYEVLLLTDPVDEVWVGSVPEFDGKALQSVAKGEVDLDSEEDKAANEAEREAQKQEFSELMAWLKEALSDRVSEVRLSSRLTESPACLITPTFGITPALARMYRASGQTVPLGKRILELNPSHPLVIGLRQAHSASSDDASSHRLTESAELLYGTALLAEGGVPDDPAKFAAILADRLAGTV